MPGRKYTAQSYRYGFNDQEHDDELFAGANSAEYWMYDARLGRRWEMDPLGYDFQSSYASFNNDPIYYSDPLGLEGEGGGNGGGDDKGKNNGGHDYTINRTKKNSFETDRFYTRKSEQSSKGDSKAKDPKGYEGKPSSCDYVYHCGSKEFSEGYYKWWEYKKNIDPAYTYQYTPSYPDPHQFSTAGKIFAGTYQGMVNSTIDFARFGKGFLQEKAMAKYTTEYLTPSVL